jgi:hypothetical protein
MTTSYAAAPMAAYAPQMSTAYAAPSYGTYGGYAPQMPHMPSTEFVDQQK